MTELPTGASTEQGKDDKNKQPEAARHLREGLPNIEVIERSVDPKQLIDASRSYMAIFENMILKPDGTVAEWSMDQVKANLEGRISVMNETLQDLQDMGYLTYKSVVDENGDQQREATFSFPGYAYTSTVVWAETERRVVQDQDGKIKQESIIGQTVSYEPGTDEQRKALAEVLTRVDGEMTAREDMVKMARYVWNQTENLEGLVQFYFMGSLTHEAMRILCDAEGRFTGVEGVDRKSILTKTEGGAEFRKGHEFGDAMSVSLQCLELAAQSENYEQFKDLVTRPGFKFLFKVSDQEVDDLFLRPEERQGRTLNATLVKWIGEPWSWNKEPVDFNDPDKKHKGIRGLLTEKGNILVESSWNDAEHVFEQIERFIGGGSEAKGNMAKKEARDARFIAWEMLRVTGMASDLGGQVYHREYDKELDRPEGNYISHEMGGMTSCDRIKVIGPNIFTQVYRFLKPEIRGFGPDGAFQKYPDRFAVPYFKSWTGKGHELNDDGTVKEVEDLDKDGNRQFVESKIKMKFVDVGKRSFDEMRWGYRKGQGYDPVLRKMVELPAERAFHLGELQWEGLHPKTYNQAALGIFIAGREKIGLFQYMMRTDWDIRELKEKTFWEKFAANMGIALNAQVVFNGRFRGIYNGIREGGEAALTEADKKDRRKVEQAKANKKATDKYVTDEVRNYKKKLVLAFWDGIRSLPQYKEWLAQDADKVATKDRGVMTNKVVSAIDRIRYRIGRIGIIPPDQAKGLPTDATNKGLEA
jgi:hypothetical protein